MSLLSARDVHHHYSRTSLFRTRTAVAVLEDVSLELQPGEIVGLLGRSGCGKSTLARLLTGLETPTRGEVLFEGAALSRLDKARRRDFRRRVQMVFQDPQGAVNPRLTVAEIIGEPLIHLTDLPRARHAGRIVKLLKRAGLAAPMAHRYPFELSGGELQRVCIARALASNPSLIVLDEAVSNLDLHLQIQMLDLFALLSREQGVAFLFVTHDLRLVERVCSRVLVMERGRVVENAAVSAPLSLVSSEGRALAEAVLPALPRRLSTAREHLAPERVC
ncbi:nickel import ATP-binding protein NikE [Vreelandella malpeensis]|uniref:Nickel import ATP-binding protein NikE n=1 Tax=Vreelandella malpeensis TaxID=1172368 RepID=A0ABS8DWW6_9GAMM|nr:nickel import ATP-binding protein NikE [Halomonas malpeensis]MCB8890550.1 nickel import ATP-binding protein NikE [Halomonas malpeensis]